MVSPEAIYFSDDGQIPNNPNFPLLLYKNALPNTNADECRALFQRNGWGGAWVNGIFSFHHYHSNAHEVLGVVSGSGQVQFGGQNGTIIEFNAGDVVVIPAGVGHCNQGASPGFRVVGAYPHGQQNYDLQRGNPSERPEVLHNIQQLPAPQSDPIQGKDGALPQIWTRNHSP